MELRDSPLELFTGSRFSDYKHLARARVFGCPVYVLERDLQDQKKLPKWSKRSWRGVFLGFSEKHHSTVALVLNPETGSVTPQYHVIFDERFSSVIRDDSEFSDDEWLDLFNVGYENYEYDDSTDEPAPAWDLPDDVDLRGPSSTAPTVSPSALSPATSSQTTSTQTQSVQQREVGTQSDEESQSRTVTFDMYDGV